MGTSALGLNYGPVLLRITWRSSERNDTPPDARGRRKIKGLYAEFYDAYRSPKQVRFSLGTKDEQGGPAEAGQARTRPRGRRVRPVGGRPGRRRRGGPVGHGRRGDHRVRRVPAPRPGRQLAGHRLLRPRGVRAHAPARRPRRPRPTGPRRAVPVRRREPEHPEQLPGAAPGVLPVGDRDGSPTGGRRGPAEGEGPPGAGREVAPGSSPSPSLRSSSNISSPAVPHPCATSSCSRRGPGSAGARSAGSGGTP